MKKILAFILTLAMVMSLMVVPSFAVLKEDEDLGDLPTGDHVQSISSEEDLDELATYVAAGKTYFYLNDDVHISGDAKITIPAGITLDGRNHAILYDNYNTSAAEGVAKGNTWTDDIFALTAGSTITFENISFGNATQPIYLSTMTAALYIEKTSGTSTSIYSLCSNDTADTTVVWNNVDFHFERDPAEEGYKSAKLATIMRIVSGNHSFTDCTWNGTVSAGEQMGGWFYLGNAATLTFVDCENNGVIYGTYCPWVLHSGSNNKISMTGFVNNATAYSSWTSTTGVFGLVGNPSGSETTIYMKDCVNTGELSLRGATIAGIFLGRTNGSVKSIEMENCVNYGDITNTGSGTTANHGFGGFTGHSAASETFKLSNCKNYGDINGKGYVGAFVGFTEGTAVLTLTNCTNYGAVAQTGGAAAVAGMVGSNRYNDTVLTNCVNYGTISSTQYAAGMIGHVQNATELNNCVNYGDINGYHGVGGMVGQLANNDATATYGVASLSINNCLNAADIGETTPPDNSKGGEGIGGFVGRVAATSIEITISNSANIGTITGSTKVTAAYGAFGDTFGQFIGLYTASYSAFNYSENELIGGFHNWSADTAVKPTLTNCYAYGDAVVAEGAKSLTGWICKDAETLEALAQTSCIASTVAVPEAPNNGVYGINVEIDASSTVSYANPNAADLADLAEALGIDFMAGAADENAIVVATPEIRGYQTGVANTNNVRFISTINSLNYSGVGFAYTVSYDAGKDGTVDDTLEGSKWVEYVYTSVNAAGDTVAAADWGAEYIAVISFESVPTAGTVVITLNAVCEGTDGTSTYNGDSYVMTITDGVVVSCVKA